jgi:hypothetical protein
VSVEQGPPGVDTSRPHPARRYDYWLDGKDNYAADRASAEEIEQNAFPTVRLSARENRQFLGRAVSYLAEREGIRQFLDIGAGLPAANNVHEVAQAVDPRSRVVYVDNDPIVLAHARVLLQGTREGATAYIDADVRRPSSILTDPDLLATLDMTQPVALTLLAIMHFISDAERPYEIVAELRDALPPGSFVVITHATSDHLSPDRREASARANKRAGSAVPAADERGVRPVLRRPRPGAAGDHLGGPLAASHRAVRQRREEGLDAVRGRPRALTPGHRSIRAPAVGHGQRRVLDLHNAARHSGDLRRRGGRRSDGRSRVAVHAGRAGVPQPSSAGPCSARNYHRAGYRCPSDPPRPEPVSLPGADAPVVASCAGRRGRMGSAAASSSGVALRNGGAWVGVGRRRPGRGWRAGWRRPRR